MEWEVMEVCRFCRCADDVLLSNIFDGCAGEKSLVSKIWNCLSLKVSVDDGLPRFICHRCFRTVNRFNIFRKTCHASNIFFREHYLPSFVRNTTHTEATDVRKEPENVSRVSSDTGNVESLEKTLDGFESDGSDVTDEAHYISSSNVEFEVESDSQFLAFEQAPYMESVPKSESPFVTDIGCDIESSERTLVGFENGGNDVTDETHYVSSSLHSNVKFEGVSDFHLSNSQFLAFEQAPYMESVPKNESPFVSGMGCVIDAERTLDRFESDGSYVTDESCSVSSRPYSNVEFEGGSHLSNSQSSVFDQAPYVELVPENESPFVTGIGRIVEGSERTLHGVENDGNDATHELCESPSSPLSGILPYRNSNEYSKGPDDPKTMQCVSFSPSGVNKSYVSLANSGPLTLAIVGGPACIQIAVNHHCD